MNPFTDLIATRPKPAHWRIRSNMFKAAIGVAIGLLPAMSLALDVNTATEQELLTVRGIGPKTAQIIVEERQRGGSIASLSDLSDRVKGIGPKKAAALQAAGLRVGPEIKGKGGAGTTPKPV